MNSHNGSPSSNSSSHSDQGSPSQNLQPQMYSSSSNKKSASNKKFADEPKQDTNIDSPTNQSHKIIPKTAHKKHRISDKSDSDNSDFDESINDRDTQGLSKMQKGLRTAAADNTEVNITLLKDILTMIFNGVNDSHYLMFFNFCNRTCAGHDHNRHHTIRTR